MSPPVFFINLAHRTDRRAQIQGELAALGWSSNRIDATYVPERGALGCALSHAVAMRSFLHSEHDYCIVVEDDATFVRDPRPDLSKFLIELHEGWDVLLLASNTKIEVPDESRPYLTRILNAQTTACYAVTRAYAPTLLACFEESARRLASELSPSACCDILWKRLQPTGRWYGLRPMAAVQRRSFSDIEGCVTFYGV